MSGEKTMHHQRKRPKIRRAGCLLCKPWKQNGYGKTRAEKEKFSDRRKRLKAH
jgi:hypothetical protein